MTLRAGQIGARIVALLQILAAIIGLFITSALIGSFVTPHLPESLRTPVLGLSLWGGVITGGFLLGLSKSDYGKIGFARPSRWDKCLIWVVVAVVLSQAGAVLMGEAIRRLTDWPPLDVGYIRTSVQGNITALAIWLVLVVWGSAAFGEELLTRGFILNRLEAVFANTGIGPVVVIVIQAAIFGALHAIQGPTGILITAYTGAVLGAVYYLSGRNLWAPIIAHGTMDTVALTAMFLGVHLPGHIN